MSILVFTPRSFLKAFELNETVSSVNPKTAKWEPAKVVKKTPAKNSITVLFDGKTKPVEVPVENVKKEDKEGDLPPYWVVAYIGNNQKYARQRLSHPAGLLAVRVLRVVPAPCVL